MVETPGVADLERACIRAVLSITRRVSWPRGGGGGGGGGGWSFEAVFQGRGYISEEPEPSPRSDRPIRLSGADSRCVTSGNADDHPSQIKGRSCRASFGAQGSRHD